MKIRNLLKQEIDIDVYDDATEELGIAFCGPQELTEEGEREFADVLDYECSIGDQCVIIHVDGEDWEHKLERAELLFESMAGYCSAEQFDKWFKE